MPKSDRMTQLVRHDVPTDAGKPQWRALKVTDSDETFVSLLEGRCKGNKSSIRQRDNQITFDLHET